MPDIPPPNPDNIFFKAYAASPYLSRHIPHIFDKAAEELAKSFAQYPNLEALAKSSLPEAIGIAQAALLLYERAHGKQRKFSPEMAYEHSLRVAEDSLAAAKSLASDPALLIKMAVKAILHDVIEDFKTTADQIREIFPNGWGIAEGVQRMTTPSTRRLVELYPDTAEQFISLKDFRLTPRIYLDTLKESHRNKYEGLKSSLKLRFKRGEAAQFTFDEAIIKCIDNPDSFLSYVKDIEERRIMVVESKALGPPQKSQDGTYFELTTAEAQRNLKDRIAYHEAVMQRFAKLKEEQPRIPNIDAIVAALDAHFQGSAAAFQSYIGHPAPTMAPGPTPK